MSSDLLLQQRSRGTLRGIGHIWRGARHSAPHEQSVHDVLLQASCHRPGNNSRQTSDKNPPCVTSSVRATCHICLSQALSLLSTDIYKPKFDALHDFNQNTRAKTAFKNAAWQLFTLIKEHHRSLIGFGDRELYVMSHRDIQEYCRALMCLFSCNTTRSTCDSPGTIVVLSGLFPAFGLTCPILFRLGLTCLQTLRLGFRVWFLGLSLGCNLPSNPRFRVQV